MSIERALIAQARPHMVAARLNALVHQEVIKGCMPDISPTPVALEPPYRIISRVPELLGEAPGTEHIPEPIVSAGELIRLRIWLSPEESFSWLNSELFLKQLRSLSHRIGFEIIGNGKEIEIRFLAHQRDLPIIQTAFQAQFSRCELSYLTEALFRKVPWKQWENILFLDSFPPPPYSHLLTRPDELKLTTYQSVITALMGIRPPAVGFYQALFQPVKPDHNWGQNVQALLDLEYDLKLMSGLQSFQRSLQQVPSGDLRQISWEVQTKAHNDKPFFSAAIRIGVISGDESAPGHLSALSTFLNLFQHGGRPMQYATEREYRRELPVERIREMFLMGVTYRPGFLANSAELAGFVHIPPASILESRKPPLTILKTLPVRDEKLQTGTPIGTCDYAGVEYPVCIPLELRSRSTHIIGKPGQAKSTTMARMILDDVDKGMGVAVLDPHGDLVEDLLCLIKEEHIHKTIYLNAGYPDHVPIWNPLKRAPGQGLSRTADDLVAAIKSVVTGWGDRLEHLLKHGLYALLQLPDSTLLDLSNLLRRKTDESERLRNDILDIIENEAAYQFWKNDFKRYSNEALDPPKHKLSKLLVSDTVSLMLSQPDSLIDFRRIMDEGMILLVNLSTLGPEVREILGCFMLSLLHLTALGRSDIPIENRKQFHIYVDEAHRFLTDALEDLISETRKFSVSLTLAHHYFSQFGAKKVDALSSVGTTIIMNVDTKDARYLTKDLRNLVNYEDLITLDVGEAIARIDKEIVRFKTPGPLQIPKKHFRDEIIGHSLRHYYRPVKVVRDLIRKRDMRRGFPYRSLSPAVKGEREELVYDEFE